MRTRLTFLRPLALAGAAAVALTVTACGASDDGGGGSSAAGDSMEVVATSSILGSIVGDVMACAGGEVTTLMQPGDDPHSYQPSSEQIVDVTKADVVFSNGLGLESSLDAALANAGVDGANIVEVAPEVDPLPWDPMGAHVGETAEEHAAHGDETAAPAHDHDHADEPEDAHAGETAEEHAGHDHGELDPHFWMDAGRGAEAAAFVGTTLAETTGDDTFATCGTEVHDELAAVDAEMTEVLAQVPAEHRVLVTDHEAFGYFADAYDFQIAGVVIPGGSTDAEPSSAAMADLVATVDETGVPAIFANFVDSSALIDAIAAETGNQVEVVELYVGSVGPEGSEGETYASMMRTNAQRIAAALA